MVSSEPSICFDIPASVWRHIAYFMARSLAPLSRVLLALKRFPFRELTRPLHLRGRAFEDDCVVVGRQLDKFCEC
jgi:hypothetical protein